MAAGKIEMGGRADSWPGPESPAASLVRKKRPRNAWFRPSRPSWHPDRYIALHRCYSPIMLYPRWHFDDASAHRLSRRRLGRWYLVDIFKHLDHALHSTG